MASENRCRTKGWNIQSYPDRKIDLMKNLNRKMLQEHEIPSLEIVKECLIEDAVQVVLVFFY